MIWKVIPIWYILMKYLLNEEKKQVQLNVQKEEYPLYVPVGGVLKWVTQIANFSSNPII